MVTTAAHAPPRGCHISSQRLPVLWAVLAVTALQAAATEVHPPKQVEACSPSSKDLEEAKCGSPSSLLQRLSLMHVDVGSPSERISKPPEAPEATKEEDVPKFLAGVPVYNYGFVRRSEKCEAAGHGRCERSFLQFESGQAYARPVKALKKDWEDDFIHNDDEVERGHEGEDHDHREGKDNDHHDDTRSEPRTPFKETPDKSRLEDNGPNRRRVREWLVKMRDGVSDRVLVSFCEDVLFLGKGNAKCTAQGHPSQGGIPLVIVRCTEEELEEQLRNHQGKSEYVEPDIPMDSIPEVRSKEEESSEQEQSGDVETSGPFSWGLDRIDDRHGLDGSYEIGTEGGKDVHVYIADTGIRTTHEDFDGRAIPTLEIRAGILRECLPSNSGCAQDASGHGTHAAATVGGRKYGVAKASTLHSVKILDNEGLGKMSYLIQALDWVATKGERPAVFMASVGGLGNPSSIVKGIEAATAVGITVIVAAGNSGQDACKFSPAHVKAAITVGATENADDTIASYSNFGNCVDLYAPGSGIHSAGAMSDTAKATMSGTSMSTPHVAGAAALLLGEDKTRTPEEVALILKARATQGDAEDVPGGPASMVLYTAELDEGDGAWWQSAWLPRGFTWSGWYDMIRPGPMKELMAEGFVCCLFLITLGFMMTQCIRFFSLPPDAYERG